jgi:hypothetical protein
MKKEESREEEKINKHNQISTLRMKARKYGKVTVLSGPR